MVFFFSNPSSPDKMKQQTLTNKEQHEAAAGPKPKEALVVVSNRLPFVLKSVETKDGELQLVRKFR